MSLDERMIMCLLLSCLLVDLNEMMLSLGCNTFLAGAWFCEKFKLTVPKYHTLIMSEQPIASTSKLPACTKAGPSSSKSDDGSDDDFGLGLDELLPVCLVTQLPLTCRNLNHLLYRLLHFRRIDLPNLPQLLKTMMYPHYRCQRGEIK